MSMPNDKVELPGDENEQKEQLSVHEKFKEEVNRQLLGCKNSLEDFEAYHTELKGVADKQKASHKKLLQHAEKTVGSQLSDAEIKIAEVQKANTVPKPQDPVSIR